MNLRSRARRIAVFATSLALAIGLVSPAAAAQAADPAPVAAAPVAAGDYLQLDKSVDQPLPQPGGTFTYSIKVTCSEEDCVNVQLSDVFPSELAGFEVVTTSYTPASTPNTVTWAPGGSSAPPSSLTDGAGFTVDIKQDLGQGVVGLEAGTTFTAIITLRVPDDYPVGESGDIVNEATVTADNANPVSDDATININVPVVLDVSTTKTWTPATQSFNPGAASTIGVGVGNASNNSVDSLTIQESKAAPEGATSLDPSNPFTISDFTGFGNVSLPAGCTSVTVSAYVFENDAWTWKTGPPAPTASLPDGVTNDAVGGIRITCTGDIPPGQTITADLGLAQRSTDRNNGSDLSTGTHTVDNVATGTATSGDDSVSKDATATHTVTPSIPSVETLKNIAPGQITAGQSAQGQISASNGPVPVSELRMSDLDFFTSDIAFGGFTAPPVWPAGASSAKVIYRLADGTTQEVPFANGAIPAPPGSPITGFEIVYTGTLIQPDSTSSVDFAISTTESATGGAPTVSLTNSATSKVTAPNGLDDTDTDTAPLVIVDPDITVDINKTVRPGTPVEPGDSVISSLATNARATGDGAIIRDIVVEDAWDGSTGGFWNAFDFQAIAPTQVPAGTSLTIEVRTSSGQWVTLAISPVQADAYIYELDATATTAALAALTPPLTPDDVEGIRFSFHNDAGFPSDTNVTPNVAFDAQSDLRTGGPSTTGPDKPASHTNTATADASGTTAGGKPLTDHDEDTDKGQIVTHNGEPGPIDIVKNWTKDYVNAQSGDEADTRLSWSVATGSASATITDPATDFDTTKKTVFDAFDLTAVRPIAPSSSPYSNGWYLKYDTVTAVELYYDGTWHTIPAPNGSWMTAQRGFAGYALTADESARTTAVRVIVKETAADSAARVAARQPGASFDPFAPVAGSGVGSASTQREFALGWRLRDITRSAPQTPVTADSVLNTADKGVVDNSVGLTAVPIGGGTPVNDRDDDTITILNQPPGVKATKSATPTTQIFTPVVGTPPGEYPTAQWQLVGTNASTAKASAVRLTDPATCTQTSLGGCQSPNADGNPFDTTGGTDYLTSAGVPNPFERFTLEKISIAASVPAQVDLSTSVVWLLHYDAAAHKYSTTSHTADQVNAFSAAQLADVVGVSVTYRGVTPQGTGTITQANELSVTLDSRLRPTLRHNGENQVLTAGKTVDVTNRVFAQSYDPVLSPNGKTGAVADAGVVLTGGVVNITPTKSITPATLVEPSKASPVTVTLGANQGSDPRSTLSPAKVVIEDQADSVEFWNTFDFVALGAVTLPAGADRVQVSVYDGTAWVSGPSAATATLPAVDPSAVQGIRFTFTRADGTLFSKTLPAANWAATAAFTVTVRDVYRDSGADVVFDHSIANTQSSQSLRPDGNDSEVKTATDDITLSPGTHQLAVNKLANGGNRLVTVGDPVPFDLTLRNTGTGFLDLTNVTDTLPAELIVRDNPAPVYTKQPDGLLSTDVTLAVSEDGRTLTFTWPEGGSRMKPGESFTIRVYLELQPGLSQGERATNTMTAQTGQPLDSCRNTETGGSTTGAWANDPTTCGTTDYVGVISGSNLYTVKGVHGSLPGAYRPGAPEAGCQQNLVVGDEAYFRAPCVANSQVDGVDDWVLHNVNAGTVPVTEMTIFDQLPIVGDRSIISGGARQSQFRPDLVADTLAVSAPSGTRQTIEVTTSANACSDTWATLTTAPVCEQSGEVWQALSASTPWSNVTGIRVHLDFTATASRALAPGQAADVTFSTINRLESSDNPLGASANVPAIDQRVFNQYGVRYKMANASTYRKIAPSTVGAHVRFGSIAVTKEITGPAAAYAPAAFRADVQCWAGDVALDMGANSVVTLTADNAYTQRIDGIPFSAEGTKCTVAEQGEVGAFGETTRSGSPTTVQVVEPAPQEGAEAPVPTAQIVTLTNDYQFTGLSVTKQVDTEATEGQFGPFGFELTCTSLTGTPVTFDDAGATTLPFTLEAGATWTAPADRIPVGATCVLTETDDFSADHVVITGSNVVDNGDGSATITPGVDPAEVQVTNGFDAGTLTVQKVVTGDGADRYGTGSFTFAATCAYQGQTLLDEEFALRGGDTRTFGVFPAGTSCAVEELTTGGATSTALDPENGTVVIASPEEEGGISNVSVTATNEFDLASFDVVKKREGNLLNPGAAGPFTVVAGCTYDVDGVETEIDVPGGAERQLTADGNFTVTYSDLPVGATCDVTETEDGFADSSTVTVDDGDPVDGKTGRVVLGDSENVSVVTITNTFTAGQIAITKHLSGNAAAAHVADVFGVSLACTWHDQEVVIPGGADRELRVGTDVVYTDLPTGAECVVTETQNGGATQVTMVADGAAADSPAAVTIGKNTTVEVVVDNRFDAPLPSTGGDARIVAAILGGGGLLLLVGALLVRRRRRES